MFKGSSEDYRETEVSLIQLWTDVLQSLLATGETEIESSQLAANLPECDKEGHSLEPQIIARGQFQGSNRGLLLLACHWTTRLGRLP